MRLLIVAFLVVTLSHASVLSDAASALKPGKWTMIATNQLSETISTPPEQNGSALNCFAYAEEGAWDPVSRQLFFIGSDHMLGTGYAKAIAYSEESNTWRELERQPWFGPISSSAMHCYDNLAIDPVKQNVYFVSYSGLRAVRKYDINKNAWSNLPAGPLPYQTAGGLEFYPELGGLVYPVNGGVYFFDVNTEGWTTLASGLVCSGEHNFGRYNPVHHVMIFGGGDNSLSIYKIDTLKRITRLSDAPSDLAGALRVNQAVVTVDPVTGDYLFRGTAGKFYAFNVLTGTWTLLNAPNPYLLEPNTTIASPLGNYGVVMYVKASAAIGRVFLYKHAEGTSVEKGSSALPESKLTISPNPFNPRSTVSFASIQNSRTTLAVYDGATGKFVKKLAQGLLPAGHHSYLWDGTDAAGKPVAAGTYLFQMKNEQSIFLKKAVLIR